MNSVQGSWLKKENNVEWCLLILDLTLENIQLKENILLTKASWIKLYKKRNCWRIILRKPKNCKKKQAIFQNNQYPCSHKNKEEEPIQPAQMKTF